MSLAWRDVLSQYNEIINLTGGHRDVNNCLYRQR
ncbi:hypothetical protein predicted by Glimmer/Critica [Lactiplantibacillus plantarum]|nr:hypothetical protein predicted by Glimmer/Critica [Lactiplantibacillus plantarum]